MTGPGLPSSPLPEGVLQAHQLGAALQGLNATKVGDTAEARLPEVFTGTLGGELVNAPIKYVLGLFAEFLGDIVDDGTPAITGPDELQDRIHDFFEDLPLVGIFVSIADAMLGNYDGDDPALLAVQDLFALLRKLLELVSGVSGDLPELGDIISGFEDLASAVGGLIEGLFKIPLWQLDSGGVEVIDRFDGLSTVEEVEGWSWDETDGHDGLGCALFTAAGAPGVLLSPTPVEVREGEQYTVSAWAKATGTSGGGISLGVQWYDAEHVAVSSSTAQTVGSPSTSWAKLEGTVTVPTGATYSRRMLKVDATAGQVRWDDVRFTGEATTIPQQWVDGLADALQGVIDWVGALVDELLGALGVPAMGDLFDRISDLADEVSGWFDDTQDRAAELGDLISDLLSDPASVIGTLPQSLLADASGWLTSALGGKASTTLVNELQATLNQFEDIFNGMVVTPVNGIVAAVKDWWDQWFGGGSGNAIPLSQKGAANGVAPLNGSTKLATSYLITDTANNVPLLDGGGKLKSAQLPTISGYIPTGDRGAVNGVAPLNSNAVVPLANLPEEVGGMGGTGFGLPYVVLYLASEATIPNNTLTTISGWAQSGSTSVALDGSNQKFQLPMPGIWSIEVNVMWKSSSTSGLRFAGSQRDVMVLGTPTPAVSGSSIAASGLYNVTYVGGAGSGAQTYASTHRVTSWSYQGGNVIMDEDDWFGIVCWQNSGSSRTIGGLGIPIPSEAQTTAVCTYLGAA